MLVAQLLHLLHNLINSELVPEIASCNVSLPTPRPIVLAGLASGCEGCNACLGALFGGRREFGATVGRLR